MPSVSHLHTPSRGE